MKYDIFKDKNAFITGASGGLGATIAFQLAESGCNLYLTGRSEKKLKALCDHIHESYPATQVKYFIADLSKEEELKRVIFKVQNVTFVDMLINCAGVFPIKNIKDSGISDFNKCFNVNVKAPFLMSREFFHDMKNANWGRIVNVGSSSAYNGSEDTGLYCASKHALLGLSRSMYKEFKEHNVRVYNVSPGSIQTEMGATDTRQDFDTFLDPEDVAKYILFVMSFETGIISEEIRMNRMIIR